MSNYSINTSRRIVHVDAQGVPHEIGKVVYCDHYATPHTVWPCTVHLTNVYIVKLSKSGQGSDVSYAYSVDANAQPSITLIPGEVYSIKGDIEVYREQGVLEKTIKNCYFFPETINNLDLVDTPFTPISGNEAYLYGNRTAQSYINNQETGETFTMDYTKYTKWAVGSDISKTGRMELQLGWWDASVGYTQNGYIFDQNFVTRLVFKRANLSQEIQLSKTSNIGNTFYTSPVNLTLGESIKFWPKLNTYVNDQTAVESWESYEGIELSISNFTYDSSVFSITQDQIDGGWIIEPLAFSQTLNSVTIEYNGISKELSFVVVPDTVYRLIRQGNPVSSPLIITENTSITIEESVDNGNTWTTWSSSDYSTHTYSFTSNDSSIISTSGNTLIPNPNKSGQSTTVDVVIERQNIATLTVQVGTITTYYKAGPLVNGVINSSTVNQLNSTNTVTWTSPSQGDQFGIQFFIDSSGNTIRDIYCDSISTAPFYGSCSGGLIGISYMTGSATSVTIPIYTDSSKTTSLGSITLNANS